MAKLDDLKELLPFFDRLIEESPEIEQLAIKLLEGGFGAVFGKYLSMADESVLKCFFRDVKKLDFNHLFRHRAALKEYMDQLDREQATIDCEPLRADQDQYDWLTSDYDAGLNSLTNGQWGFLCFAGGAGTRFFTEWPKLESLPIKKNIKIENAELDLELPKGLFPISPVFGLNFIERNLANMFEIGIACGKMPVCLLMTSDVTDSKTNHWLDKAHLWGMPKECVMLFKQDQIVRLDEEGDLIAKENGSLIWTGNGHGGVYQALESKQDNDDSMLDKLESFGIKHLSMGNVDNTALNPLEPSRLGFHLRKNSDFTLTTVKKIKPEEKVGVTTCLKDSGSVQVVEYSVLDKDMAHMRDEKGDLLFNAAHINSNLLKLEQIKTTLPGTLYTGKPVQVAGRTVDSSTFEMLNQDLAGLLDPQAVHIFEGTREDCFLPTKAILGVDSVESTFYALTKKSANLLQSLGADLARDDHMARAYIELHPCLGLDKKALQQAGLGKGWRLDFESSLYLAARNSSNKSAPFSFGLHLMQGASLIIDVKLPYGKVVFDSSNREVLEDIESSGKVHIAENVTLRPGVSVSVEISGNGVFEVARNYTFSKNLELVVADGETVCLGA